MMIFVVLCWLLFLVECVVFGVSDGDDVDDDVWVLFVEDVVVCVCDDVEMVVCDVEFECVFECVCEVKCECVCV